MVTPSQQTTGKAHGGRPSKFTPAREKIICDALRQGLTKRLACQMAGIDLDTLANWTRRYPEFSAKVAEAEGACARALVATVQKAARKDWKAATWMLSHRFKEDFGDSQEVKVPELGDFVRIYERSRPRPARQSGPIEDGDEEADTDSDE